MSGHLDAHLQSEPPCADSALHDEWSNHLARAETGEASSAVSGLHTHEPVGHVGQKQEDEIQSLCPRRLEGGVEGPPCEPFLEIHVA